MIKMTALSMGFYNGAMVRPGAHFDFDVKDGDLPKWAVPFGTQLPAPLAPFNGKPAAPEVDGGAGGGMPGGDTKPLDAQRAAHLKAGTRPSDPVELHGFF